MTIYPDIARALLADVLPLFAIGGTSWTRTRTTAHTPAANGTSASVSLSPLYVIDQRASRMTASETGFPVLDSAWAAYAPLGTDVQANDVITNGIISYAVVGAPETHIGLLVAPLEIAP